MLTYLKSFSSLAVNHYIPVWVSLSVSAEANLMILYFQTLASGTISSLNFALTSFSHCWLNYLLGSQCLTRHYHQTEECCHLIVEIAQALFV